MISCGICSIHCDDKPAVQCNVLDNTVGIIKQSPIKIRIFNRADKVHIFYCIALSVKIAAEISRIFPLSACKVEVVSKHVISPIAHIFELFCGRYDDRHFVYDAHDKSCNSHDFFALFAQRRIAVFDICDRRPFLPFVECHRDFCRLGVLHDIIVVCKQISCRSDNNTINRISRFIFKRHKIIILLTFNNHFALFAVLIDNFD